MSDPVPHDLANKGAEIREALAAIARERILILDGAMGTMIQGHRFTEEQFRGARFADWPQDLRGNNDLLVLTQPKAIEDIHFAYAQAGADLVATNTFNSTTISQADYGMEALVPELNREAARLCRAACDRATAADGRRRFVVGSLGPTNKHVVRFRRTSATPAYPRELTFDAVRARCLRGSRSRLSSRAGVRLRCMVETIFDTLRSPRRRSSPSKRQYPRPQGGRVVPHHDAACTIAAN